MKNECPCPNAWAVSGRTSCYDICATANQPKPHGKGPDIAELVKSDIDARAAKGIETYGEPLKPHNGRDALIDAYQEALDLCQYLRQMIFERDGK